MAADTLLREEVGHAVTHWLFHEERGDCRQCRLVSVLLFDEDVAEEMVDAPESWSDLLRYTMWQRTLTEMGPEAARSFLQTMRGEEDDLQAAHEEAGA